MTMNALVEKCKTWKSLKRCREVVLSEMITLLKDEGVSIMFFFWFDLSLDSRCTFPWWHFYLLWYWEWSCSTFLHQLQTNDQEDPSSITSSPRTISEDLLEKKVVLKCDIVILAFLEKKMNKAPSLIQRRHLFLRPTFILEIILSKLVSILSASRFLKET